MKVTVRDTVSARNGVGFVASENNSSGTIDMNLENCVATDNAIGATAAALGANNITIRVSNSVITGNEEGVVGGPVLRAETTQWKETPSTALSPVSM